MATIDPEALRAKLENQKDVCIVDIRSEEDYEEDHIENSENRPIREAILSGNVEEALAELDDLPTMRNSSWFVMQESPRQKRLGNSKSKGRMRLLLMAD